MPIGGGGLLAGIAVAIKHLRSDVMIFGVEPRRAASWTAATQAGRPVKVSVQPTLADGLAVLPGELDLPRHDLRLAVLEVGDHHDVGRPHPLELLGDHVLHPLDDRSQVG